MYRKHAAIAAFSLVVFAGSPAIAWDYGCRVSKNVAAGIDTAGATKIVVRAAAGDLDIRGIAGAARIEARGGACAPTQALLDGIRIEVRRVGPVVYVETVMPSGDEASDDSGGSATLNLGLAVPNDVPLAVTDSSGDTVIANIAALEIQDSSGDLTVRDVAGAVNAIDSSGDLTVDRAQSVRVTDSSGNLDISNIKADVLVDSDTSGDIFLRSIAGHATVRADSSGDINATDVDGNFHVEADGSGSISHSRIRGEVSVPD